MLRVAFGLTVAAHGSQKLFGWFGGSRLEGFAGMLEKLGIRPSRGFALLAGLSEFGGGLLVALGFLSPVGPLVVAGAMAVAIITVHLGKGFFNQGGGMEFPLLILLTMLTNTDAVLEPNVERGLAPRRLAAVRCSRSPVARSGGLS